MSTKFIIIITIYKSSFIYFITIIALVLVLFIGKEVGGAKAWFSFGQFGLQPAEFAKIGTIGLPTVIETDKEVSIKNVALFKPNHTLIDSYYLRYVLPSIQLPRPCTQVPCRFLFFLQVYASIWKGIR